LALLLVTATYPDYPKPAAAQGRHHPEWMMKLVTEALEKLGFVVKDRYKALSTVFEGIKLPTGYEILNFHGGAEAVKNMLKEWGLKEIDVAQVIAYYSTNKPIDRDYDLYIVIAGRKMIYLGEIKSANDLTSNVVQTVREALYDSYMAAKGDAVVWFTQGRPKQAWAQRVLDYISKHGVGVSTSLGDEWFHAQALEAVTQRVYQGFAQTHPGEDR